ncbi:ferruginol synthase-like [Salvia miltiorrhiza]|uniref:ferruginol synthase-like n=1 Tax=Salvia miltiorrhiza TaxID=226208 RepID=UPI0025ABDAC2|nr:ferruginol synthase-like [Salvia miltiorrhiza]
MDPIIVLLISIIVVIFAWFYVRRRGPKLPPGPYPFPIIGNILQLGRNPHQSLADLSKTHGPLMSLKLGSIYTVVVSSPELAKLFLQEHDQVFSGRTISAAAEAHEHDKYSMALMPAGERWKKARRLCREHMFSARQLEAGAGLRREKLQKLLDYVRECSVNGRAVNLGEVAFVTSLNLLTVTLFSVDFTEFDSDATQQLKETIEGVTKVLGAPNVADFFPFLKRWDPQGIKRRSELHFGKLLAILRGIINERLESRSVQRKNDLLDTLLDVMEGSEYDLSFKEIQHVLLDLFLGGSDSTQSTVEWAMTELLAKPEKMSKAKNELRSVVGENNQVEESDVSSSRLPYLGAVIKETLRLHPPGPLLIPRRADREVEIGGYMIPQNAQIFVNVWAIGRDSSIWPNATSFEPERFLDSKIELKGQDFELIPFGSGRRMCPGLALADRMLHLMLGSLLHNFDWKMEGGVRPDTQEEFGLALHKALPLKAIPLYCF